MEREIQRKNKSNPGQKSSGRDNPNVSNWIFFATAAGIVLVALLLRIYHIGQQELWLDEAGSLYDATAPDWVAKLPTRNNPPFYYFLINGWVAIGGQSEAALRMPSACFGTLFVAALIWLGRELLNSRAGLWSGFFAAIAPFHIYYSQEARGYALLLAALLLTYGALWRALTTNGWRWWAFFSTFALLCLYTHYFAILGLIPTVFLLLLWPERRQKKNLLQRYVVASSLAAVLFLPWFLWSFVFTPRSSGGFDWLGDIWKLTPPVLVIPRSLEVFGLGGQIGIATALNLKQFAGLVFPEWLRLWEISTLFILGIWIAVPQGDGKLQIPWIERKKAWLWIVLFFPPVLLWLVSFLYKPIYLVGRYELAAFPAYCLLLGLSLAKAQGLEKVGKRLVSLLALALFIPIGFKDYLYYQAPSPFWGRPTAAVIDNSVQNGDVVLFTGTRGLRTLYYLSRLGYRWKEKYCVNESTGRRFSCRMFPRETEEQPARYDPRRVLGSSDAVRDDVRDFMRVLPSQNGRLWIVSEAGSYSEGHLNLPKPDSALVAELERMGRKPVPIQVALGIFVFP